MPARTLPGLGLKGFYAPGENGWGDEMSEGLRKLSVLVQGGVLKRQNAVPGDPDEGDVYILTGGAHADSVAVYDGGEWTYYAPEEGWLLYDRDANVYVTYNGAEWEELATGGGGGGGGGGTIEYGAQEWRLVIMANNGNSFAISVGEFIVREAPGGPNVEGFAAIAASTANGSFPAANAKDGNAGTFWLTNDLSYPQILTLTFGEKRDIREWGIQARDGYTNECPSNFLIQWKDEDGKWQDGGTTSGQVAWGASEVRVFPIANPVQTVVEGDLSLPPITDQAGRVLAVKDDESGIEWIDPPAGSGGGGGGGGSGGARLPGRGLLPMAGLDEFDQVGFGADADRTVEEVAGRAIVIRDLSPTDDVPQTFGLSKPAPVGPYRVVTFIEKTMTDFNYTGIMAGWIDAAGKIRGVCTHAGDNLWGIENYSDPNTRQTYDSLGQQPPLGPYWLAWRDDGANVYVEKSHDGVHFATIHWWAKTDSYLADYDKLYIGIDMLSYAAGGANYPMTLGLLEWDEDGLNREYEGGVYAGGGGSTLTPPKAADFPVTSYGGAEMTWGDGENGPALVIAGANTSGGIVRGQFKDYPASPCVIITKIAVSADSSPNDAAGFTIWDETSGEIYQMGLNFGGYYGIDRWTANGTGWNGYAKGGGNLHPGLFYRFEDDGVNYKFSVGFSKDGPWMPFYTVAKAGYLANPSKVGFTIEDDSTDYYILMVEHYHEA